MTNEQKKTARETLGTAMSSIADDSAFTVSDARLRHGDDRGFYVESGHYSLDDGHSDLGRAVYWCDYASNSDAAADDADVRNVLEAAE